MWPPDKSAERRNHMKKLSLAIAVLAAAVVFAGPLNHKSPLKTTQRTALSTIQADYPFPICPPDCGVSTTSPLPQ